MLIFGIEELPRPKGQGFLYYKLDRAGREFIVDYLDLYNIADEDLKALFLKAAQQAFDALSKLGRAREIVEKKYQTENMADFAADLLRGVITASF